MATPIWIEKESRWKLRITINGEQKNFSSVKPGIAGKKEVLRRAREYELKGSTNAPRTFVRNIWNEFLADTSERIGAHSEAYKQHEKIGRLYILPAIGAKRIGIVNKRELQNILNTAKPHNKRCKELSKKYLTTIRATIVAFIKFSYENGYCEPLQGQLYIPQGHPTVGKNILQPSDIRRLFEPSELHYHRALCFLCATGLRPSEVLGLKWSDIDGELIHIRRGVNSAGVITEGKNENARRTISMNAILGKLLDEQREATKALRSEWIFCSHIGSIGSESTMRHHLEQLCSERGFNVSPYSLRHTFISMVKNEMPEQMIKSIVGHSASMDTFGVYGHVIDGELKQAALISEIVFSNIQEAENN